MDKLRTQILEYGPHARRWLLASSLVVIPWTVMRTLYGAVNIPKFGLLLIVVSVAAAIRLVELTQGAPVGELRRMWMPAAGFLVPLAISWMVNPFKAWTFFGEYSRLQGLFPYLIVVAFGVLIGDAFKGHLRMLAWALTIAGAGVGLLGSLQALGWNPGYTLNNVGGAVSTLGNPNFTGGFLAILLPVPIALVFEEFDQPYRPYLAGAAFLCMSAGIVFSNSQGAWIAAATSLLITAGYLLGARWRRLKPLALALVVVVALGAIGTAASPLFSERADSIVPATAKLRGEWWLAAGRMGLDSPAFGSGPNAFGYKGVQYRSVEEARIDKFKFPDDPHSVIMSVFANTGLLGILGLGIVAFWLMKQARIVDSTSYLGIAFIAAMGAYFAQALVSIDEIGIRLVAWSIIGGLGAAAAGVEAGEKKQRKPKRESAPSSQRLQRPIAVALAMTIPVAGIWFSTRFVVADRKVVIGLALFRQQELTGASDQFAAALSFRDEYEYRHLLGYAVSPYMRDPRYLKAMRQAFAYLSDFPDLPAMRDKAYVLAVAADEDPSFQDQAADAYMAALEVDPLNPALRTESYDVFLTARRWEDVLESFSDLPADALDADTLGAAALASARLGDTNSASQLAERAISLDPDQEWALQARELIPPP